MDQLPHLREETPAVSSFVWEETYTHTSPVRTNNEPLTGQRSHQEAPVPDVAAPAETMDVVASLQGVLNTLVSGCLGLPKDRDPTWRCSVANKTPVANKIRRQSLRYTLFDGVLYLRSFQGLLLKCVTRKGVGGPSSENEEQSSSGWSSDTTVPERSLSMACKEQDVPFPMGSLSGLKSSNLPPLSPTDVRNPPLPSHLSVLLQQGLLSGKMAGRSSQGT
ncbi:hypothetical protein LIER_16447 [Lithospermum erythrorhizon]|uniref:Uncharacterized protein n=1 Tax=Lithospermum erythrorhizon TaxID=34254 RepID=A0AAV3Q6P6_LITER